VEQNKNTSRIERTREKKAAPSIPGLQGECAVIFLFSLSPFLFFFLAQRKKTGGDAGEGGALFSRIASIWKTHPVRQQQPRQDCVDANLRPLGLSEALPIRASQSLIVILQRSVFPFRSGRLFVSCRFPPPFPFSRSCTAEAARRKKNGVDPHEFHLRRLCDAISH
jgi:hypothetical protein